MVACASPGWDKYFPDPVRLGITAECVHNRGFLARQIVQTNPAVIVFSGGSAFEMFFERFRADISPTPDQTLGTHDLLKRCAAEPYYLKFDHDKFPIRARLVFSPHFSYPDGFRAGCRFDETGWSDFKRDFPEETGLLAEQTRTVYGGFLVRIDPSEDKWKTKLGADVLHVLSDRYIDPQSLIADILQQEYDKKNLVLDPGTGHFKRTQGPCRFCDNQLFKLGEGCRYADELQTTVMRSSAKGIEPVGADSDAQIPGDMTAAAASFIRAPSSISAIDPAE